MGSDRLLEEQAPALTEGTEPPAPRQARFTLAAPEGISPRLYHLSFLGPLSLSASLGVQAMLLAVLAIKVAAPDRNLLTDYGAFLFMPERDVDLYILSTLMSLGLACVFTWLWNHRLRSAPSASVPGLALRGLATQGVVAVLAVAFSLAQFFQAREFLRRGVPVPGDYLLRLAAAVGLCVLLAAAGSIVPRREGRAGGRVERALDVLPEPVPRRLRWSFIDLAIPFVIFLLIYLPEWRQAAGRFFLDESLFHWDYYSMGPALNFLHGKELGTQISSMYGIGWPMVFAAAFSWLGASYGRMIQIGSIYGCIYLCGVYLLLRLLVRRPMFAALGTGFIALQLFVGQGEIVIWRFPSLTPMRFALDVWCFAAIIMYSRSSGRRKTAWAAAAGAAVGLAVVFSTDTGLYLGAAAAVYWACLLWQGPQRRSLMIDIAAFGASAVSVLGAALLVAGRGDVFSSQFVRGWLESILEFGGGFAQLPLATVPNAVTVVSFVFLFFAYLLVAGYMLARLLHRQARQFELFNGMVALYGTMCLLHFVGRSGDYTPFRLWIPLGLIAVNLAGSLYGRAGAYVQVRWGDRGRFAVLRRLPYAVVAVAVAIVLVAPRAWFVDPILSYPNLVSARIHGTQPDGLCLLLSPKDICGLPTDLAGTAVEFRAIAHELEQIEAKGNSVAVIDETGSLFYLATDTTPWERYPRAFVSMHTKAKLDSFTGDLRARPPDYVLTRMPLETSDPLLERWPVVSFGLGPGPDTPYKDAWNELRGTVQDLYSLDRTIPPFELWRLSKPAGS